MVEFRPVPRRALLRAEEGAMNFGADIISSNSRVELRVKVRLELNVECTGRMGWMAHRKWKKIKQQPSMLPGPAVPGSYLASFHFLWAIHPIRPVHLLYSEYRIS